MSLVMIYEEYNIINKDFLEFANKIAEESLEKVPLAGYNIAPISFLDLDNGMTSFKAFSNEVLA